MRAYGLYVITPNGKQRAHRRRVRRGWSTDQEPNPGPNVETISLQAQLQPPYLLGAFRRRSNNR